LSTNAAAMISESDILAAFGLSAADLALLQTMKVAEDESRTERDHFVNDVLPKRMAEISAKLTDTLLPADSTLIFTFTENDNA